MRVISQNGDVDLPYERIVVMRNFDNVIAVTDLQETQIVLGRYSSAEKAEKAIEMLRDTCKRNVQLSVCLNGIGMEIVHFDNNEENNQIAIDCRESLKKNTYFQFPKDDEVEV